ncbi:glycoside hydrolase family 3 N-terminal domain-containing protein [Pseudactinotalea sp. Z1739]|uniref:glycoside hydrolase family 3 N-terminal domain-containing protein n=1 Tax=Pseudactinotalea sp. Z1739 TaxID=3413028 RepID=UPI003C7A4E33
MVRPELEVGPLTTDCKWCRRPNYLRDPSPKARRERVSRRAEAMTKDHWAAMSNQERLARLLLVRSSEGPDGLPSEATIAAIQAGVGAFHGPPLRARPRVDGAGDSRRFNAVMHERAQNATGLDVLVGANAETGLAYTTGAGGFDIPYPAALGQLNPVRSRSAGRAVGRDLDACGYNWCFQPVADVRTTSEDPVIGVRAFGTDPGIVGPHMREYGLGLQEAGVIATVKHFPGHGDANVDSHLGLPVVRRTDDEWELHLSTFAEAARADLGAAMTAHLQFEDEGDATVSTFDPRICTELLRNDLGFTGLLVSDSLRMAAVSDRHSPAEAAMLAISAGCDIANVKCSPEIVPSILEGMERGLLDGTLPEERVYEAFGRVLSAPLSVPTESHQVSADIVPLFNEELHVATLGEPNLPTGKDPITMVMAEPSGEAPDADALGTLLTNHIGRTVHVQYEVGALSGATVMVSYGQAGPTAWEADAIASVEGSGKPAVVLMAGPPDTLDRYTASLPAIAVPALDVFGMPSLTGFTAAFRTLLTTS